MQNRTEYNKNRTKFVQRADTDEFRIIYLMLQLEAMRTAIELHHADIRAYFHWSLLDNYEWGNFDMHFGLASVDRQSFLRTPKPSAYFYRDVIRANGMSGKLFAAHTPALPKFDLLDMDQRFQLLQIHEEHHALLYQ